MCVCISCMIHFSPSPHPVMIDVTKQAVCTSVCLHRHPGDSARASLYQQLQQEQLTEIEPGRPAQLSPTLLPGRGAGGGDEKGE